MQRVWRRWGVGLCGRSGLAWGAPLVAWLLVSASSARADEGVLRWTLGEAAEGCIDGEELGAALRDMGTVAFSEVLGGYVEGSITGLPTVQGAIVYTVVVQSLRSDGTVVDERRVSATVTDCRALDDAIVVIVALMLDRIVIPVPPAGDARGRRLELTTGVGVATGPLPGVALDGALGLTWLARRSLVEVAFAAGTGSRVNVGEGTLTGYRLAARLTGCGRVFGAARLELHGCGSAELGRLTMRTEGFLVSNDTTRLAHARLGLALRARLALGDRLVGWAQLAGDVALGRPTVTVPFGSERRVFRPAYVGGVFLAGVSVRVP